MLRNPSETKKQNLINDEKGVQSAIRIARPFSKQASS